MKTTLQSTVLILCLILSACDSTTPQVATATTPPPAATPRPSDTPKPTLTATVTDTATPKPTEAQTESATPGPTDTPSATFTISATNTPTETPTSTTTPTRTRRPPTRTSTSTLAPIPVFINRPDIQGCNVNYSLGASLYGHGFIENPVAGPNGLMRIAYFLNGKQVTEDRPLAQVIEIGPLKEGDVIGDASDTHTCLRPTPPPGGGGGGSGDLDKDGDGYTPNGGDCNDNDPSIYPGAPDPMDPIDQNCDGNPNG